MSFIMKMSKAEFRAAKEVGQIGEAMGADVNRGDAGVFTDRENGQTEPTTEHVAHQHESIPDFINTYRQYADVYELPAEVHEAIALALLAAASNGNVWIELGDKVLSRFTIGSLPQEIFRTKPLSADASNTPLAFLIAVLRPPPLPVVITFCREPERAICVDGDVREVAGSKNTPPIEFKVAPRTTFVATSSFEWLLQNLSRLDSTGGFLARWMHVHVTGKSKRIPIPSPSDKKLVPVLAARLRKVSQLEGAADLSAVRDTYAEWYEETAQKFEQQPNQDIAEAYWNRHRDHLLKLTVLFEMSRSGSLKVSPGSMKRAMAYAEQVQNSLFKIFPTGFEREGYELERMILLFQKAGRDGLPWSAFTRAFKNMDTAQRIKRLRTLMEAGDLHRFSRPTSGRTGWILVHKDFVEEYRNKHPEDTEAPWV